MSVVVLVNQNAINVVTVTHYQIIPYSFSGGKAWLDLKNMNIWDNDLCKNTDDKKMFKEQRFLK
jgi:hypothetical protein